MLSTKSCAQLATGRALPRALAPARVARCVARRYKEGEHDVIAEANKTLSGEWPATWVVKAYEDQMQYNLNAKKVVRAADEDASADAAQVVAGEWPASVSWSMASYQDLMEYYEKERKAKQ